MSEWEIHLQELEAEASEILMNIRDAARSGEITFQQKMELDRIVLADVADQANIQLARDLLYAWQDNPSGGEPLEAGRQKGNDDERQNESTNGVGEYSG